MGLGDHLEPEQELLRTRPGKPARVNKTVKPLQVHALIYNPVEPFTQTPGRLHKVDPLNGFL